jgi:hypothetical protein
MNYHDKMEALVEFKRVPGDTWEDKIAFLGYKLRSDATCPLFHSFEPGWYIREIHVPAKHVFIGRPHVSGHICKLVSGQVLHVTEEYRKVRIAPFTIHTTPGYRAVFYTFTDIVGRTYHPNPENLTDVSVLEAQVFAPAGLLDEKGKAIALQLEEAV